jgi:hypothetical protein
MAGSNITLTNASPQQFVAELDERGVTNAGLLSGPSLLLSFGEAGLVTGTSSVSCQWSWEAGSGCSTHPTHPSTGGSPTRGS